MMLARLIYGIYNGITVLKEKSNMNNISMAWTETCYSGNMIMELVCVVAVKFV